MITRNRIASIEAGLADVVEDSWSVLKLPGGALAVEISYSDRAPVTMRVTREREEASQGDVDFIAHAPRDLQRLIDYVTGRLPCTRREIDDIRKRVAEASRAPWRAFLKGDGGVGGDSVIWVSNSDNEPDMYLWIDSIPAPDKYFEFVAAARQDIPDLLTGA